MNSFISLSKALARFSGLENSLVYLKNLQLNKDINFSSLSGDNLVWRKYYEK